MVEAAQVHLCKAVPPKGARTASTKARYRHSVRTPSVSHHSASLIGRSQSPDNMQPEVKAEGGDKRRSTNNDDNDDNNQDLDCDPTS